VANRWYAPGDATFGDMAITKRRTCTCTAAAPYRYRDMHSHQTHGFETSQVVKLALQEAQNNAGVLCKPAVVRLVGELHNDKSSAFKFMARQLCGTCGDEAHFMDSASPQENEQFLLQALKHMGRWATFQHDCMESCQVNKISGHVLAATARGCYTCRKKQSVIFVLNDLSEFISQGRCMMLYTLLDWLHTDGIRMAVIGISTADCVLAKMEKRAASRFSTRTFLVPGLDEPGDKEVPILL
jgi:hypothetical protein